MLIRLFALEHTLVFRPTPPNSSVGLTAVSLSLPTCHVGSSDLVVSHWHGSGSGTASVPESQNLGAVW